MFSKKNSCLIFLFCLPLISGTSIVRAKEIKCLEKCEKDGWKCSRQDVNELNDQLQSAIKSIGIPLKGQYPEDKGESSFQMGFPRITVKYNVNSLEASVESKDDDSILLQWNREENKIKSGSICMTGVDAEVSVGFGVAVIIFGELPIFGGTISMKVKDFSALLEMSSEDDKLTKEKCETNPNFLEIKAKNNARVFMNPFLRGMMKSMGGMGSSLFGDAFGDINIPSALMEPMISLLTGDEATEINVCEIIDTIFNMFDNESLDGVASFFEQQVNILLDDLEEENGANSIE